MSQMSLSSLKLSTIINLILIFLCEGTYAQDYVYDRNGNLTNDYNKQITSIHYNHLNLVDTILFADGRKIVYTYAATGHKLREQAIAANGTNVKNRDYVNGGHLYVGDTLREILYKDGRAVPTVPGSVTSAMEYQYYRNDHLGNVRATLTSIPGTDNATATFETGNASTEQHKFLRGEDARRINSLLFDHTRSGPTHYAQRLNGSANERNGIGRSLSVMPGDIINMEAYAKFVDPNASSWTTELSNLLATIASGTAAAGTVIDGSGYLTNGTTPFPFAGLSGASGSIDGPGPKAYLNWLVFDRHYVFRNGGYVKMSDIAREHGNDVAHEKLAKQLIINEPGYVYVYVSNEEHTPVDVYFDDVTVDQVKGPVIQQADYEPFGTTFNEYSRENTTPGNFSYNGKELQKDFDLNWFDFGARMYDAALGRWLVPDPMAANYSSWSPYNYVMNNPVKLIDPDGMRPIKFINDHEQGARLSEAALHKLSETPAGRAIIREAEKNGDINIYISGQPKGLGSLTDALATTATAGYRSDKSGKKTITYVDTYNPVPAEHRVFAGEDITTDVNNSGHHPSPRVYTIALDESLSVEQAALVLAHEIDIHVNFGEKSEANRILIAMKMRSESLGDAEHELYGSTFSPPFDVTYNPKTKKYTVRYNSHLNTRVQQVGRELATVIEKEMNK